MRKKIIFLANIWVNWSSHEKDLHRLKVKKTPERKILKQIFSKESFYFTKSFLLSI